MFSGITKGLFPVARVDRQPGLLTYRVTLNKALLAELAVGASVSIDGVCQTVVSVDGQDVTFQAMQETLDKTTLVDVQVGQSVSVERSVRVGDEIGGHEVSGHVVGTAQVVARDASDNNVRLSLQVPSTWMKYIQPKGFIAVDGSSLTVGKTDPAGTFTVYLIPETLRVTNFDQRQVGDRVNVELDQRTVTIVDTVERVLASQVT